MLHDTDESNIVEEENSHDHVALFEKSTALNTIGLLVSFACQGTLKTNTSSQLVEIEYPFDETLWLRSFPCCPEEFHRGNKNEVSLCLDFRLLKCNWVDTGQQSTLLGFLLFGVGAHGKCDSLALSLGSVISWGRIPKSRTGSFRALLPSTPPVTTNEADTGTLISKKITISFLGKKSVEALCLDNFFPEHGASIPTGALHYVEVYLEAKNVVPYVWDPGIGFEFSTLTSYIVSNAEDLLLLECTGRIFCSVYSNSMSRVWDTGQPWCVSSSSNECSVFYNCILFTCPSIAYTLVLHEYYYDVPQDILAANFKHTSVMHLHYIIVLATMFLEWKVMVLRSGYKVKFQVEKSSVGYTLYGVIEMVGWAARYRLHHGLYTTLVFVILLNKCVIAGQVITEFHLIMPKSLTVNQKERDCNWLISIPMERFGGRRASNTSHRYFKVNISIDSKGIDAKEEWSEKGIAAHASRMCLLLLENMTKVPSVATRSTSISSGDILRCIALLDTSHIIKHPCHVIPELTKNNAVMSKLLQAANQFLILFLKVFACCSQVHNTPSCPMTFSNLNLEDKVLFVGGCIVVNRVNSVRAYGLEVVNEIG